MSVRALPPVAPGRRPRLDRRFAGFLALILAVVGSPRFAHAQDGPPVMSEAPPIRVILNLDAEISESYTGPVFVVFGRGGSPRSVPRLFGPDPIVRVDVVDWMPGIPLVVDNSNAICAPMDFDAIPKSNYFVQAFLPVNPDSARPGDAGNVGSSAVAIRAAELGLAPIELTIDLTMNPMPRPPNNRIIPLVIESTLLSAFLGRPALIEATVVLPPGYTIEADRVYPTRYWFGSHGAEHLVGAGALRPLDRSEGGNDIVTVLVEVTTRYGHPLYVDSDVIGPWATAFREEVVPAIEARYRLDPAGRFLTGHGAGGYTALALLLKYPEAFHGAWALAPWPLSIEDWFGVDLTAIENMYLAPDGTERFLGVLRDGQPVENTQATWRRDDVLVNGGPFRSYEWAFSPRRGDGDPMPLFDRTSGAIDSDVVAAWARHDLIAFVAEHKDSIGDSLRGKPIEITVGGKDGLRLADGAKRFTDALNEAGVPATFNFEPDSTHQQVARIQTMRRILKGIVDIYQGEMPNAPAAAVDDAAPASSAGAADGI